MVEDVIPLYNLPISVQVADRVTRVACVPRGETLAVTLLGDRVRFTVPELNGYQVVEVVT